MKKSILVFSLFLGITLVANAQITTKLQNTVKTATTAATASGVDITALKTSIISKLTSKLNLSAEQQTTVGTLVTNYLTQKASIASLATTDKVAYTTKLTTLTSSLKSKLKNALSASQYTKYLSLKPATNTTTNVLSQLFY
ncbi:MAG: hypothetical protein QM751_08175 [Paludibacteraceae bacterium]